MVETPATPPVTPAPFAPLCAICLREGKHHPATCNVNGASLCTDCAVAAPQSALPYPA